tara:strand:+ start:2028 stop:2627 length:600 start_codon:yes stop_codon:yes gene_type:complete
MIRFGSRRRNRENQTGFGRKIAAARMEEEKLRDEGIGLYDETLDMMEAEQQNVQRDLRAGVDRAASQTFGRGLGRARSGGALRGQSQLEMDLRRQAGEARRRFQTEKQQVKADQLAFKRQTMKTSTQLQAEASDHKQAIDEAYDRATFLGFMNDATYRDEIDNYIDRMGLTGEAADAVRSAADDKRRTAFFNISNISVG